MIKKNKVKLTVTAGVLFIFISSFIIFISPNMPVDHSNTDEIMFTIESGDSVEKIIKNLKDNDLIKSVDTALEYSKRKNLSFYPNTYSLNKSMKTNTIMDIISKQESNLTSANLVIFEGNSALKTAEQIEEITNGDIKANDMLKLWRDKSFLKTQIDNYWFLTDQILSDEILFPLEGYLSASTYEIPKGTTPEKITTQILNATDLMLSPYEGVTPPNGYTLHDMLSLASIIERETKTKEDKYIVSGVFYNRLNLDMFLQSDITVLYAMQEHKELVTFKDLEIDSPYNTYLYKGLTPGPIASPSIEAIDAAFKPSTTDYLYFFATQDTGEVIYTKTYEEHLIVAEENAWE
ncbi:MAG: endolytic transglycosylase MltG [Mycoplasmatales bacterium]